MNIYDLKEGDTVEVVKPYSDRKVEFTVVTNIVDDVLFLFNENNGKGIHLFYDDLEICGMLKLTLVLIQIRQLYERDNPSINT